jgi:hypothetical protein
MSKVFYLEKNYADIIFLRYSEHVVFLYKIVIIIIIDPI